MMRVITTRHSTTRIYCVMRNVNKQSYSEFVSAQQQHVFLYSIRNSLYQKGYLSSGGYGHNERKVPKSLLSLFRSGFRQFFRFDCVSRPSFAGCCSCMDIEHIPLEILHCIETKAEEEAFWNFLETETVLKYLDSIKERH